MGSVSITLNLGRDYFCGRDTWCGDVAGGGIKERLEGGQDGGEVRRGLEGAVLA